MYSDSIIHRYKRDGVNFTKCFDLSVFQNPLCTKPYTGMIYQTAYSRIMIFNYIVEGTKIK